MADEPSSRAASAPAPHYALPSLCAELPEYTNAEADAIAQAFRSGNFCSLKVHRGGRCASSLSRSHS